MDKHEVRIKACSLIDQCRYGEAGELLRSIETDGLKSREQLRKIATEKSKETRIKNLVSKNFNQLVNLNNITIKQVAIDTGISANTLSSIKNKQGYRPIFYNIVKLANYFKVPLDYFVQK